jgi:competence protein ComEC
MVSGAIGIGFTVAMVVGVTLLMVSTRDSLRLVGACCVVAFLIPVGWVATDLARQSGFSENWQILNCDVGQGDALLVRDGGEIALIDVGRDDQAIDSCLRSLSITHIDLLVLTHFDADHIGGIRGAVKARTIGLALISGFRDERPLVSVVLDALKDKASEVSIGYAGMAGALGMSNWRVLSPTFDAQEAMDSNDASLVVIFSFRGFSLLALGDLGESGQARLMRNSYPWLWSLREQPLVIKVAHHGSQDQSAALHELIQADVALFSVGAQNDYGHPTRKTLSLLQASGARVLRTDIHGPIALRIEAGRLVAATGGKLSL